MTSELIWLILCGVVVALDTVSSEPISLADKARLTKHARLRRQETYPSGFKYLYVGHDGMIEEYHKPATGNWIRIVGSPYTPRSALYTAAMVVSRMLHHAPAHIFNKMATLPGTGVGIYTAAEKLTVYPELSSLADTPECKGRCDGDCKGTCMGDGRKFDSLSGLTSRMSYVLMDNFMCTSLDPHYKIDNILVHEFAHSIHEYGLNSTEQAKIHSAYANAKANDLWRRNSYAMSNVHEYFAEGTGAFFFVNLQGSSGGMSDCAEDQKCQNEQEIRDHIRSRDPKLFSVLADVYTSSHPDIFTGLNVCP